MRDASTHTTLDNNDVYYTPDATTQADLLTRVDNIKPDRTEDDVLYELLLKRGVVLSSDRRREQILSDFEAIGQENPGFEIEIDSTLLDEIVAITEHPTALLGSFDARFLALPQEVIITSMKSHQRYFPVFKDAQLSNHFVVVSNALSDDYSAVIAGNEKVLRPRLADALFFWHNDRAAGLGTDALADVLYVKGLGSMLDKVERERAIADRLLAFYKISDAHLPRAAELAKADLDTQMVYEFTELQGVMGMHYARAAGEEEAVARAILEQYLPLGEGGELPESQTGTLLAITTRLDSLMGLFSIGLIPTGSKDPLALRRAAAGFLRLVIASQLSTPLDRLLETLSDLYAPYDRDQLEAFILDRLYHVLEVNPSLIKAVLATGERDIVQINQKVQALDTLSRAPGFKEDFTTFKRVANILKNEELQKRPDPDRALFEMPEEKALYEAFSAIKEQDSYALLEQLFGLKPLLDAYFETVMVNAEDAQIKGNRLATMAAIYLRFMQVADIKEIAFG